MLHYDTHRGLADLPTTVVKVTDVLRRHADEYDSIAVQGTSAIVVGAPVALALGKPLVIVREDEALRCHHSKDVENAANSGKRVLFLDDQISTGRTLKDVQRKIAIHTRGVVVASYQYQYDEWHATRADVPAQRGLSDLIRRGW